MKCSRAAHSKFESPIYRSIFRAGPEKMQDYPFSFQTFDCVNIKMHKIFIDYGKMRPLNVNPIARNFITIRFWIWKMGNYTTSADTLSSNKLVRAFSFNII